MSLDLYYLPMSSPCRAVLLTVEALGLSVNLKEIDLFTGEHLKSEYEQLNPQRTIPFLVDGDYKLSESRAIMCYLVDQYGKNERLYPQNPVSRALVNQRLYFDIGKLYKNISSYFYPVVFKGAESYDEEQYEKLKDAFNLLDKFLEDQDYVAGRSLTIADLALASSVSTGEAFGFEVFRYKYVSKWMDRIKSSAPGYRKANGEGLEILKKLAADRMSQRGSTVVTGHIYIESLENRRMIIWIIAIQRINEKFNDTERNMPIDLYQTLGSAPCCAVRLTAASVGVTLNLKEINLMNGEQLKPEFLKMNPQHTVPTIDDNGFYLSESRAIMGYLVDQYGKNDSLYPKDPKKRAIVNQRLFFDANNLYQSFADYYYPTIFAGAPKDQTKYEKLEKVLEFLDKFLENETYVAGKNMTIADHSIAVTVSNFELMNYDLSKFSHITKWYKRMKTEIVKYDEIRTESIKSFKGLVDILKKKK
ncbi:uncharacterized protein LOC124429260 [Vespa crabro]|uniref:uncharacterized protein LOC124429260 n=1 Tax=Vespa crabro TaxID=7445 RepID=UPI001F00406B|nr:uncharacterized protein LOC124429260 [Vespa crabro]